MGTVVSVWGLDTSLALVLAGHETTSVLNPWPMSALTPKADMITVSMISSRVYAEKMAQFEYSVWFKNHEADPTDQDYEWVACFLINATTTEEAKDWGDLLSRDFAARNGSNEFLSSAVSPIDPDETSSKLPKVNFGELALDELIGW